MCGGEEERTHTYTCTYGEGASNLSTWLITLSKKSAVWQNGKIMEKDSLEETNRRKHDFCPIKSVFKIKL